MGGKKWKLLWFFAITGMISLGFWWRGKFLRSPNLLKMIDPLEISYVIETKPPVNYEYKRQSDELVRQIENLVSTSSGEYAMFVYHLHDGTSYGFNETLKMPAASIMKVPIMVYVTEAVAEQKMNLEAVYTMEEADRVTGSGPLQFELAGTKFTIGKLLNYLGKNSDNTAWAMFNRRIGKGEFEETIRKMGMEQSSYSDLTTTAKDVARMFAYIYEDKAGGETGKQAIYEYLSDSIYEDRLPKGVPDDTDVIHKVGTDEKVWSDAGIILPQLGKIYPYIIVIMNKDINRKQAGEVVIKIAKMVWDFENKNGGS
jgi:beta-lactamase class A